MHRGDRITITHCDYGIGQPRVAGAVITQIRGGRITYRFGSIYDACAVRERGITWARGWSGPEVDALRTYLALGSAA